MRKEEKGDLRLRLQLQLMVSGAIIHNFIDEGGVERMEKWNCTGCRK